MKIIILFLFLLTISCSNNKVVNNHGHFSLDLKSEKIIISKSNKNDVINIIGKPSTVSLFNENLWVYIQREKVNQSVIKLGKSKISKNNVLEIYFDEYGVVKEKKLFKTENINDIQIAQETTEKNYGNATYLGKLLSSVRQKIDSPKLNRKKK